MKFKQFIIEMFSGENQISSKRICGFLGGIICLFVCVWCTVKCIAAPDVIDVLFICSSSLLGIDSVTSVFRKNGNGTKNV